MTQKKEKNAYNDEQPLIDQANDASNMKEETACHSNHSCIEKAAKVDTSATTCGPQEKHQTPKNGESECTCEPINLRVLFLNVPVIDPTISDTEDWIRKMSKLIDDYDPNIIAFVVLFSNKNKANYESRTFYTAMELPLQYYRTRIQWRRNPKIATNTKRNNDNVGRSGGIFLAFRFDQYIVWDFERTFKEDYSDSIMGFEIDCQKCRKCVNGNIHRTFGFSVVYRRFSPYITKEWFDYYDDTEDVTADKIEQLKHHYDPNRGNGYSGYVIVGDFDFKNLQTDSISELTHTGVHALDQVICNPQETVSLVDVTEPIRDNSFMIFQVNLFSKGFRLDIDQR